MEELWKILVTEECVTKAQPVRMATYAAPGRIVWFRLQSVAGCVEMNAGPDTGPQTILQRRSPYCALQGLPLPAQSMRNWAALCFEVELP